MEDSIVWLKQPVNRINNYSYDEGNGKVLYKNPCLKYLGEEINSFIDSLDNETKASPGKYFVKETNEVDSVYLFNGKCPDGFESNPRKSICEVRPGIDEQQICMKIDPLTRKSEVDMLKEHIQKIQQQGGQQGGI